MSMRTLRRQVARNQANKMAAAKKKRDNVDKSIAGTLRAAKERLVLR